MANAGANECAGIVGLLSLAAQASALSHCRPTNGVSISHDTSHLERNWASFREPARNGQGEEATLSWCDKLASVPTVGFKLDAHFGSGDALLDALSPITNRLIAGDTVKFSLDQHTSLDVALTSEDGFQYMLDATKVAVGFRHRLKAKAISGGPPIMEMLSTPLPYTQLLPEVSRRLSEAVLLMPNASSRQIQRVGVLASTQVSEEDLPPGISRFIEYMGRPWGGSLEHFKINLTCGLEKTPEWTDRCIHTLTKPEDMERLLTLQFDWQRTFTTGRSIGPDSVESILATAHKASTKYFEDLAEGNRFDEEIIRATARA